MALLFAATASTGGRAIETCSQLREDVLPVDGQECEFRYRTSDDGVVAYAHVGDHTILVHADQAELNDIELVRITDVQPYVDGLGP